MHRPLTLLLALLAPAVLAGPAIQPGDLALRHDIQRLADHGIITGTITTWPLAWGPILEGIELADAATMPPAILDALA
ncbi:MAG: capsule assembly Wzi family protein, partial [Gammaproteobacteria bacterium]|nr:capsule assembly Wzi family protein [Gammaproteobacteria bacterium]